MMNNNEVDFTDFEYDFVVHNSTLKMKSFCINQLMTRSHRRGVTHTGARCSRVTRDDA
jgi:hypothetical protein